MVIPDHFGDMMSRAQASLRVIRLGHAEPWWVGRSGECEDCRTLVEITDSSFTYHPDYGRTPDNKTITIGCPGCGGRIIIMRHA